ncbi:hypothetical protein H9Y04_35510 [Streptomyces sp. TRM66268-LWL]|uniref:Phage portal protein n=1 Tax=Streptomyces polyasparticus TaxID=2767826 RepID=A0ABR7SU11_9ACTN|nr:hypothetical protein [Streptomyces polyasparticus]MBC9717853.1 hypothetical protein [Streptomyces polyasparticus]
MRRWQQLIIDTWGALAYKPAFQEAADGRTGRLPGHAGAAWVPETDRRRLAAYTVLAAYDTNQAAALLGEDGADRREYGDPALIVNQTLSHLLGETQKITLPGTAEQDSDLGSERETLLKEWADSEHLWMRMQHAERTAVLLGDTVYLVAWSRLKNRPVLQTIDPGFYFPVLTDAGLGADDYPERVHLAWEVPAGPAAGQRSTLRRVTYELGPISDNGDPRSRRYPWSTEPSDRTCYLTDAEWDLEHVNRAEGIDALSLKHARFRTNADGDLLNRLDLQLDFIPIVHVPNTITGPEHFGQSSLMTAAQLLDDLGAADTDSQRAAATTGSPIIGLSGARLPTDRKTGQPLPVQVQPGMVWPLGDSGQLSTVDTSAQLAEMRSYVEVLRDRLSVVSRLPGSVLGTVDPSQVPSGYAMRLSFGPLNAMVRSMRLARAAKYPLLLKMVMRLYQAGGVLPASSNPRADVAFGSYLPSDQAGTLDLVTRGVQAGVLSLETGLRMLAEGGFPIEDAAQELQLILAEKEAAAVRQSVLFDEESAAADEGPDDEHRTRHERTTSARAR